MRSTEDELRRVLAERSAQVSGSAARLVEVHERINRHRRRARAAAAAGAAAVVGVAVAVPAALTGNGRPEPQVAAPASSGPASTGAASIAPASTGPTSTAPASTAPLPVVPPPALPGSQLLGSGMLRSPRDASVTVTFTPTSWQLDAETSCDGPLPGTVWMVAAVNGHTVNGSIGCSGGFLAPAGGAEQWWSGLGVRLHEPSTLTVVLAEAPGPTETPSLCAGCPQTAPLPAAQRPVADIAVGIYQREPS